MTQHPVEVKTTLAYCPDCKKVWYVGSLETAAGGFLPERQCLNCRNLERATVISYERANYVP